MPGALSGAQGGGIGKEEFARLLENLAPLSKKIAVAVSGGPDSMALAFCLKRWNQRGIIALIVNHGLRAEATAEAVQVKIRLENLGLNAEILRWEHGPVAGRLHEKARVARYDLLAEACVRHGVTDLFLAHQREDQAETILMRLAKGSGVEGLAGMEPQSMRGDLRLLRPFLAMPKERLIATCAASQIPFVTDPSNRSKKFARGRLRAIMPLLAPEGLTVDTLIDLGARAAEAAQAVDHYAHLFLREAASFEQGGSIRIDRPRLQSLPRATANRALSFCLRHIHDAGHPPERAGLAAILDIMATGAAMEARTFYGCILSATTEHLFLLREPAAAHETLPMQMNTSVLWDKRWQVTWNSATETAGPFTLRALGLLPHGQIDRLAPDLRRRVPQGRVRATLPALWRGDELCAIPSFDPDAPFGLRYRKAFP